MIFIELLNEYRYDTLPLKSDNVQYLFQVCFDIHYFQNIRNKEIENLRKCIFR